MSDTTADRTYPGERAEVQDILDLAQAYHAAAKVLLGAAVKGKPLSYAPARFCAIHAIELCRNAYLRSRGVPPAEVRARWHNLEDREFAETLGLRKRTAAHLIALTERREYLISRYGPEVANRHTELNRLAATLDEVMGKVGKFLAAGAGDSRGAAPARPASSRIDPRPA